MCASRSRQQNDLLKFTYLGLNVFICTFQFRFNIWKMTTLLNQWLFKYVFQMKNTYLVWLCGTPGAGPKCLYAFLALRGPVNLTQLYQNH